MDACAIGHAPPIDSRTHRLRPSFLARAKLCVHPDSTEAKHLDLLDFFRRRLAAALRLLLKSMQHVDGTGEPDGINGPVGVTVIVLDHLQDAGPVKAL